MTPQQARLNTMALISAWSHADHQAVDQIAAGIPQDDTVMQMRDLSMFASSLVTCWAVEMDMHPHEVLGLLAMAVAENRLALIG